MKFVGILNICYFIFFIVPSNGQPDRNLTAECAAYFSDHMKVGKGGFSIDRSGKRFVIALLLPKNQSYLFSLHKVNVAVRLGITEAKRKYLASDIKLDLVSEDTQCSEIYGPLNAVKLFIDAPNRPNVFLGPNCLYVLSMVARFASSPIWSIPVISTDAQAKGFDSEKDYGLLIRLLGSYDKLGHLVVKMYRRHNWNISGMILERNVNKNTLCFFMLSPVKTVLDKAKFKVTHLSFTEKPTLENKLRSLEDIEELLKEASLSARSNYF